jgi:membrane protein required for colicin V production
MTLYDLIFLGALLFSLFMGVTRGGTREIITLVAFFAAILISLWIKPWLVTTFNLNVIWGYIAVGVIFIGCYFGIRYLGHSLSDKLHKDKTTNIIDRVLGFGFGIVRTLVFLGVFHLIFSAVTPIERQPNWFRTAKVYPLSVWSAKTIQHVLPSFTKTANQVAPSVAQKF